MNTRSQAAASSHVIIDLTLSDDESDYRYDRKPSATKKNMAEIYIIDLTSDGEDDRVQIRASFRKGKHAEVEDAEVAARATPEQNQLEERFEQRMTIVPKIRSYTTINGSLFFTAPDTLASSAPEIPFSKHNSTALSLTAEECPICLEEMVCEDVVKLNTCTHSYHKACIEPIVSSSNNALCPVCRASTTEPKGKSPSGRLHVYTAPQDCAGVPSGLRTIAIQYTIVDGIQKSYDPHPGAPFLGIPCQTSFVPNNPEGRDLLKRIIYAFRRGLSFEVFLSPFHSTVTAAGFAVPNGAYKTGTRHEMTVNATLQSWSDPSYFQQCHKQLDLLKVPPLRALVFPTEIRESTIRFLG